MSVQRKNFFPLFPDVKTGGEIKPYICPNTRYYPKFMAITRLLVPVATSVAPSTCRSSRYAV